MTIKEYFQTVDSIAEKTREMEVLKKKLSENRRNIDLDEAKRLYRECRKAFQNKKTKARLSFVFLFVMIYGMTSDAKIPHSIRYILSIILKVDGSSISRDWRMVKKMMTDDQDFAEKVEEIYGELIKI